MQDFKKKLLVHQDSRHLLLINAKDPHHYTYLRIFLIKTLVMTNQMCFSFLRIKKYKKCRGGSPECMSTEKKWRLFILILTENKIEILMSKLVQNLKSIIRLINDKVSLISHKYWSSKRSNLGILEEWEGE
jgi:hypothetical protein